MSALLTLMVLLVFVFCENECKGLNEEYTWTRIDYQWPDDPEPSNVLQGREAMDTRKFFRGSSASPSGNTQIDDNNRNERDLEYIFENNIPMGANKWKDKLFVTVPRRRFGVPSTLNYVWTNTTSKHNVPLIPYPSWDYNRLNSTNRDRIVSVYRTAVDTCDRLWFVDAGVVNSLGSRAPIRPPTVFAIDLNTDTVIRRYELKSSDLAPGSIGLSSLTIDVDPENCNDTFAYIVDLGGYGLIVYDFANDSSWRVTHNYFAMEPSAGDIEVAGIKFQWTDGIFSTALGKRDKDGFRTVFFHSMVGRHMYAVSSRILRNRELATRTYHGDDFKVLGDRGPGAHTTMTAMHEPTGVLFMGLINQNGLGCWNTNKEFLSKNFDIVDRDEVKMIYPSDVKVSGDDVIVLTNNMPLFIYSSLDYNNTNFRVWTGSVQKAIEGTTCSLSRLPTTLACNKKGGCSSPHVTHALENIMKLFRL
ncbi:L-dopachrome tautomerase yellow-f2 [Agrilus planipennis]|uniref:L-dopachrome tautomerase yellow-f2 n=1 Tax=Agrilus planipennis TaxID=224129 RepID=A0A1W4XGZ7_AGRPL|nr:L-dopachrome tautomerase yellow-f2 [Agrilus planipennis]